MPIISENRWPFNLLKMNKNLTEFKEFLTWFCSLEEIPLQSRHNFLTHITKAKKIDEKARKFIEDTLERLSNKYGKEAEEYRRLANNMGFQINARNAENSLENNIVHSSEEEMMHLAVDFKEDYQANESFKAQKAEEEGEQAEVERLKAEIG